MNFGSVLNKWENLSKRGDKRKHRAMNKHWLDDYPPDARALRDKDEKTSAHRSEVRVNWRRRPHQDVLDLHGMTREEARKEVEIFISLMQRCGLRKGLIIHGKGLHSEGRAILDSLVRDCLENNSEVGEFGRAQAKDGGSGATWFLLRQRSR